MRLIHCLLAAVLLTAHGAAAQPDSAYSIRSYQVPVEHQGPIESVLAEAVSAALGFEQRRRGVSSPGKGLIVVTAPPYIHADVERFLRDFQPTETASLRTQFWIVRGEPGAGGPLSSRLEPIAEVLSSISSASGEMNYLLEEHVEILSRSGRGGASATVPGGQVSHQFDYVGDKVVGTFSLSYGSAIRLSSEIAVPPGQFIVLGRTGVEDVNGEDSEANLFVILHSQVAD